MTAIAGNIQGITKGEFGGTMPPANPVTYNIADPRNPDYRKRALMRRNLMIGGAILLLIGFILLIKKYPKGTIGTIAVLFVIFYIFGMRSLSANSSRWYEWTHGNGPKNPTMARKPVNNLK